MDDDFKFAQHVANAAYDYEMATGNARAAAETYHEVFNLVMHRADIDRAYGKIMAIYGLSQEMFAVEYANDAMKLLDKPLGQQSYVEAK